MLYIRKTQARQSYTKHFKRYNKKAPLHHCKDASTWFHFTSKKGVCPFFLDTPLVGGAPRALPRPITRKRTFPPIPQPCFQQPQGSLDAQFARYSFSASESIDNIIVAVFFENCNRFYPTFSSLSSNGCNLYSSSAARTISALYTPRESK